MWVMLTALPPSTRNLAARTGWHPWVTLLMALRSRLLTMMTSLLLEVSGKAMALSFRFSLRPANLFSPSSQNLRSVVAYDKRSGLEVWRKLLNKALGPVTLLLRGNILFASSGEFSYCIVVEEEDAALAWRSTVSISSGPKPLTLVEGSQNTSFLAIGSEKLQILKAFDGQMDKTKVQAETSSAVTLSVKNDIFLALRNGVVGPHFSLLDPTWAVDLMQLFTIYLAHEI